MTKPAASAFVRRDGKILLVRRSAGSPTYPGLWSAVSGSIEPGEDAECRSRTEMEEETGIADVKLVASVPPVRIEGWEVHGFLYDTRAVTITLNRENTEYRWVKPDAIKQYDTVPGLSGILSRLLRKEG